MTFATPRDLAIVTDGAPASMLDRVSRAEGRVMRIAGDTLYILVEDTDAGVPARIGEAAILPDTNTRVELRRFSGRRTAALAATMVAMAVAILAVAYASTPWTGSWTWIPEGGGY